MVRNAALTVGFTVLVASMALKPSGLPVVDNNTVMLPSATSAASSATTSSRNATVAASPHQELDRNTSNASTSNTSFPAASVKAVLEHSLAGSAASIGHSSSANSSASMARKLQSNSTRNATSSSHQELDRNTSNASTSNTTFPPASVQAVLEHSLAGSAASVGHSSSANSSASMARKLQSNSTRNATSSSSPNMSQVGTGSSLQSDTHESVEDIEASAKVETVADVAKLRLPRSDCHCVRQGGDRQCTCSEGPLSKKERKRVQQEARHVKAVLKGNAIAKHLRAGMRQYGEKLDHALHDLDKGVVGATSALTGASQKASRNHAGL